MTADHGVRGLFGQRPRTVVAVVAGLLALLVIALWPADPTDLAVSIREIRRADPSSKINIAGTARRHIPIGSHVETARALLAASRFEVNESTSRRYWSYQDADRMVSGRRYIGRWCVACSDEWRLLVYSKGGRVVHVSGYIFYHSL